MSCVDTKAYLASFADGELDGPVRAAVVAHTSTCADCAAEVATWQRLRRSAARGIAVAVPAGLEARVRVALAQERRARVHRPYRWVTRVTAAAAVIMLALVASYSLLRPVVQIGPVRAADFVAVHRLCAIENPHDMRRVRGSDPALIVQKIRDELGFVALVPNLSREGYKLDGLCTCLRIGDAHTIHAFYRPETGDGATISVFSVDRPVALADAMQRQSSRFGPRVYQLATVGEISLVEWSDVNGAYALTAPMGLVDLVRIADGINVGDVLAPESAGSIVR